MLSLSFYHTARHLWVSSSSFPLGGWEADLGKMSSGLYFYIRTSLYKVYTLGQLILHHQ
ncbi:MAG: hypothetical protein ACI8X3_001661 [Saprospiraceae bacterium]|jgi:hypothetical protein